MDYKEFKRIMRLDSLLEKGGIYDNVFIEFLLSIRGGEFKRMLKNDLIHIQYIKNENVIFTIFDEIVEKEIYISFYFYMVFDEMYDREYGIESYNSNNINYKYLDFKNDFMDNYVKDFLFPKDFKLLVK